jgi:hypothetical protein
MKEKMEAQFNELKQMHQKLIQSLQCEIWRNIDGYDYSVSNYGRIKNNKFGRILKPSKNKNGYLIVRLSKDGVSKTLKKVHRLVANAFIFNPENKKCVDHIDNNRSNNNINNLRWATNKENNQNKIMSKNNTSGIKGVSFNKKAKKWEAQITIDGIRIFLGYFDNIEDAKQARIKKANEVFGVFLNDCEKA